MSIYEYECQTCSEKFEQHRNMNDNDHDIKCPKCGAENPRRIFSVFSTGSSSSTCPPGSST